MATSLSEQRRSQLDSIVSKMEANGEKPETVQFVVNDFKTKYAGETPTEQPDNRGMIKKAWDVLSIPEQKAREGLNLIAENMPNPPEPTGNLPIDLIRGFKPIVEKSGVEALAKTAPSFISPLSLALMGGGQVLKYGAQIPAIQSFGRGAATQMESLSGAVPGSIKEAAKDATLMGAKGKQEVTQMYEKAKAVGGEMRQALKDISDPKEFVDESLKLAKEGKLNPTEGLEARKVLSSIKKRVTDPFFRNAKGAFDKVAKMAFAGEDAAYQRANMAESLRNIAPQNKYGGTSAFKLMLAKLASDDGLLGKAVALSMSPAVQGGVATVGGVAGRTVASPQAASAAGALYNAVKSKGKKK